VPRLSSLVRSLGACSALLIAVNSVSAQANPFAGGAAPAPAPGGRAPAKANGDKYFENFRAPWTKFFNDNSVKDETAGKRYMGYHEAYKAFHIHVPNQPYVPDDEVADTKKDNEKKDDTKKEETKSESQSTSMADAKPAPKKKKPNRIDVHFVDMLDKDGDHKVDEEEFNKWADAYCHEEADAYAAEINKANAGLTPQQQQALMKQYQNMMRGEQRMMANMMRQQQQRQQQMARAAQQKKR
jgi:hypothetical protein